MFRNYIITSYRFIVKSKTYTILNLAGLVVGLTASFTLLIFTINELSYDRYHSKEAKIYRVISQDFEGDLYSLSQYTIGPLLEKYVDGISSSARITFPGFITGSVKVRGTGVFSEEPFFASADQSLLNMFDIPILEGDKSRCLDGDSLVILSDRAAQRYFGKTDPLGKILKVRTAGLEFNFTVSGVYRSFPWNSSLQMDVISGIGFFPKLLGNLVDSAEVSRTLSDEINVETFVMFKQGASEGEILGQIPYFRWRSGLDQKKSAVVFQPLRNIYMDSGHINDFAHKKGSRTVMFIYLSLALFVLLLAGINYSILSTARSALRHREIGVRKVLGASRRALSAQVLMESVLLTFLSFPISYLLLGLSEPILEWIFGYRIDVYSAGTLVLVPLFAAITLFIGLISGAYIAFYLSALNPLDALKNKLASHRKINLSRIFIVFQLLITLSLLISVITIYRQVNFCINSDIGLDKRNLAVITFDPSEVGSVSNLKQKISKFPEVVSISGASSTLPDIAITGQTMKLLELNTPVTMESIQVDVGFFRTMGIRIIAGSDFDPSDTSKSTRAYILNKEAARILKFSETRLNKALVAGRPVIAIVDNFNIHTMYDSISPALFMYRPEAIRALVIRYKEGAAESLLMKVRRTWEEFAPGQPLEFSDFSGKINMMYKKEQIFGFIVAAFAFLAFIIMGMGLFGLAILISERKIKETAIRKVFGASNVNILYGMQKEFLVYIGIASAIAIPSTILLLRIWLNEFSYRISMSWWIFLVAIVSVTIFVSSIILTRTLRVLRENPAKALKYE